MIGLIFFRRLAKNQSDDWQRIYFLLTQKSYGKKPDDFTKDNKSICDIWLTDEDRYEYEVSLAKPILTIVTSLDKDYEQEEQKRIEEFEKLRNEKRQEKSQ